MSAVSRKGHHGYPVVRRHRQLRPILTGRHKEIGHTSARRMKLE